MGSPVGSGGAPQEPGDCVSGTSYDADQRRCNPCNSGEFCPGSDKAPQPCATGLFDDDDSPATACIAISDCAPGTYVKGEASPVADRQCGACASGHYTDQVNATECLPHTACSNVGWRQGAAGTASSDTQCLPYEWVTRIGAYEDSDHRTVAYDLAVSATGELYVTGSTNVSFDGQQVVSNRSYADLFVSRLEQDGTTTWTRFYGTQSPEGGRRVATGPQGDVYVAGIFTHGSDGITYGGDVGLLRYGSDGELLSSEKFGHPQYANGIGEVVVASTGTVYVAWTWAETDTTYSIAHLSRYAENLSLGTTQVERSRAAANSIGRGVSVTAEGEPRWLADTCSNDDYRRCSIVGYYSADLQTEQAVYQMAEGYSTHTGEDLLVDSAGNTYVVSRAVQSVDGTFYLRRLITKLDSSGAPVWTRQAIDDGGCEAHLALRSDDEVIVTSCNTSSHPTAPNHTVLVAYDSDGNETWRTDLGAAYRLSEIVVSPSGALFALGAKDTPMLDETGGTGQTFVAKLLR